MDIAQFFTTAGTDESQALPVTYDPLLVIASYVIATLAGFAFLRLARRIGAIDDRSARLQWMSGGALIMGLGVWAMHFVGMLAYRLPTTVAYDPVVTAISAVPAVLGSAIALHVVARPTVTVARLLLGGTSLGLGIGAMHYTGMAAMRLDALVQYDPTLFTTSIFVAVLLAIIGLSSAFWTLKRAEAGSSARETFGAPGTLTRETFGALIIGLAVSGMHYTAMASTLCFASPGLRRGGLTLDPHVFAAMTTTVASLVMIMTIVAVMIERRITREISRRQQAVEERRQAEQHLVAERAQSEALQMALARNAVLLREIHHRVKNNLQIIGSLISIEAGAAKDPDARRQFGDLSRRVRAIGRVHQRIYESDKFDTVEISGILRDLCADLVDSTGREAITCECASETPIETDTAVPVVLITNELITNAIKHGTRTAEDPIIVRSCVSDNLLTVEVEDRGPGLPPGFDIFRAEGFGLRMAIGLAHQAGGNLEAMPSRSGAVFKVSVPLVRESD